jgi:GNAT superfamily N-acetyltransferase
VHVKICETADAVAPLLPQHWIIDERVWMMVGPASVSDAIRMPEDYTLSMEIDGSIVSAEIFHRSGVVAARGKAALVGDRLVFDQIVTEEAHRRRGLGRSIMAALTQAAEAEAAQEGVLVATDEGAALYSTLGWSHHAPVTSAVIPAEERPPSC